MWRCALTILVGPLVNPTSPFEALAAGFARQVDLAEHHVELTEVILPDEPGLVVWRWDLTEDAPAVLDRGAWCFDLTSEGRVAFPVGEDAHPHLDWGLVFHDLEMAVWMIVADDQDDSAEVLVVHGLSHVEDWLAGRVAALDD